MCEYTLIRSDRKSLSLEIARDLSVIVRAPRRMPQETIDRFVQEHEEWIASHREKQQERGKSPMRRDVSPQEEAAYRARAQQELPLRVKQYSEKMGLVPQSVRITSAKTRFGSCSARGGLCFSWRLMQYPQEVIDAVIVHELAHLKHPNHSRAFYDLVRQYLPDYEQRRKLLL